MRLGFSVPVASPRAATVLEENVGELPLRPKNTTGVRSFVNTPTVIDAAVAREPQPEPEAAPEPQPQLAAIPEKNSSAEADGEPEVASAAPKIPTKATVAKQATFKNAINLSKLNLIGVYGTQSKRYALVRTAAGRYKKVRVGDTIDGGGRVAAITATEVRYQKGGRLVALAMPKG